MTRISRGPVRASWLLGTLLLSAAVPAAAAAASAPSRPIEPVPIAVKPPVIDGVLDDEIWSRALHFDGFKTFKPDYGKEPSQKTDAYMAYDPENIYFGVHCSDTEPSKIKAAVSKRDAIFQDDLVGILLDTFGDCQNGFGFMINPLGIQGDGMLGMNGNLDDSHDMVWYSKGRIGADGWTVEARVPLQSIRFPKGKALTMRVLFFRFHTRTSEQFSFPPLDPAKGSIMVQSQPIRVEGLRYKRVMEVIPAVTASHRLSASEGRLRRVGDLSRADFGLTGKFGLTSDLTADAAYNPDFSQVESDAGQIDINRRYENYYSEKRPFFLEGNDIWMFGGGFEDAPLQMMVHTRRIVDPIGGFRLTGKVAPKDTVAVIYAKDDLPGDPVDASPDFGILRYKHTLKEDGFLGGFYTARETGSGFNRVGGMDGRFRLTPASYASFHLFGSFTKDPLTGMAGNKADHALGLFYEYADRSWVLDLGYQDISPDFRVDTGFLTRTGLRRLSNFVMRAIYPKSKFFQKIEPFWWAYHIYDTTYRTFETVNLFTVRFQLPRSTQVRFDGILGNEVFLGRHFDLSQYGFQVMSQVWKQLYVQALVRHGGNIYYDAENPFQGTGDRVMAMAQYQANENLNFDLSLTYVDLVRRSDRVKIYDYTILRNRNTWQVNKYFFLRFIPEYNFYRKRLTLDLLASFTYIPGTVIHLGYGSAFERLAWDGQSYIAADRFLETQRGFFFKVSYLQRF